jgi:hypothetical protein
MQRKEFIKTGLLGIGAYLLQPLQGKSAPISNQHVQYYTPLSENYNALRTGFNSRINKHPLLIAVCENAIGVQQAVQYANLFDLPVSIKSGGHCMEGFSCGEQGMQIIVSSMKKIAWIDKNNIRVGPGCLLHELYETLLPRKKILPGGSCATVGIGGLTLGGGYGLLSRQFGLTCDNVTAVKMIDGKGRLVDSAQDPRLLWACKGGGNGNFGAITELSFRLHDSPAKMSSYRFRAKKIDTLRGRQILSAWFEASKSLPKQAFSACLFNGNNAYILLTHTGAANALIDAFISSMKAKLDTFTANRNQDLAIALQNYYGQQHPVLFKNASAGLYKSFQDIESCIDEVLQIVFNTKGMIYQVNTLGGVIQDATAERNSAFPHRAYAYFSELQTYWDIPKAGERLQTQFQKVQEAIAKAGIEAQYRNYPDIHFTHYAEKYYGQHLEQLQQIKQQYDPENRFRHEQSIRLPV